MSAIIDFHTHAFPDELAKTAIPYLENEGNVKACLNGTTAALLESMDKARVEKSVICSIATKPSQFSSILGWSKQIRSDRLIPFPSIHPEDSRCAEHITRIKDNGFQGIKMHPYYQNFFLAEERLFPVYEKICDQNLILVMHTGFDIAFPPIRRADPAQILDVISRFPDLKIVTTHLGAWDQWEEVADLLAGRPVYMETSYTLEFLKNNKALDIINSHPQEYILFGTDSPWSGQQTSLNRFEELGLDEARRRMILGENALNLLNSV